MLFLQPFHYQVCEHDGGFLLIPWRIFWFPCYDEADMGGGYLVAFQLPFAYAFLHLEGELGDVSACSGEAEAMVVVGKSIATS